MTRRVKGALFAALVTATILSSAARAESLGEALFIAYSYNPTLQSARYDLRAIDEEYVQAWSRLRPTAEFQANANYAETTSGRETQRLRLEADPFSERILETNENSVRIVVEQELYSAGRNSRLIDAAGLRVQAEREVLRATEGDILLQVITAYADVRRDTDGLEVQRRNLASLERQVDLTKARREAGEVTLTDEAQAIAQLEAARAQLALALAQLQVSRASYAALVGQNPAALDPEPPLPLLPATLEEAYDVAERFSPDLQRAVLGERESRTQAAIAKRAGGTSVRLQTAYGFSGQARPFAARDQDVAFTAGISISKPLYAGGANLAGFRAAMDRNTSDRLRIDGVRRAVLQNVITAWNQAAAARANVNSKTAQLRAAQTVLEGMQEEYRAGQRSTFDVLNAEQSLREAELSLISSGRDAYVAEASLLRYVGRLEGRILMANFDAYNPADHLRSSLNRSWVGLEPTLKAIDHIPPAKVRPLATVQIPPTGTLRSPSGATIERDIEEVSRTGPPPAQPLH